MPTKLSLRVIDKEGKTSNEQFEIGRIKGGQLFQVMSKFGNIFSTVLNDKHLTQLFLDVFTGEETMEEKMDQKFLANISGSIELLFDQLPDETMDLLAAMSGIKRKTLEEQDAEELFDVYDAVIEENDIEKLVTRAKKSWERTQGRMAFISRNRNKAVEESNKAN